MELYYSLTQRNNPRKSAAPAKWYATLQYRGTLDLDDIAEHIAQYHGRLYDAEDIKHVATLFCKYAQDLLMDGYRLHLNGLGTLYLTCHSTGVTDKMQLMVRNRPTRLLQLSTKVLTDNAFARIIDKVKFRIVPNQRTLRMASGHDTRWADSHSGS